MYIIYNFSLKLIRKKIIAIFNKQINVDLKVDLDAVSIKKTPDMLDGLYNKSIVNRPTDKVLYREATFL